MKPYWAAALRRAVALGLSPDAFWALSIAEWRALTAAEPGMTQTDLGALMRRYPDRQDDDNE